MILPDTDHMTVLFFENHSQRDALSSRLLAADDSGIAATVVSLEEQMRGWLAALRKRHDIADQIAVYPRLTQLVEFYSEWKVVPFDRRSADAFKSLRRQRIRIGTEDLKIASIALVNNALLLSANLVDFQKVPGLKVEDWLYPSPR
jgi:tRNA(fMet)-specific endonuclease VapC